MYMVASAISFFFLYFIFALRNLCDAMRWLDSDDVDLCPICAQRAKTHATMYRIVSACDPYRYARVKIAFLLSFIVIILFFLTVLAIKMHRMLFTLVTRHSLCKKS